MKSKEIFDVLKVLLEDDPNGFAEKSFNRRTKFKFVRRSEKFYVTVELPPEVNHILFSLYLKAYCTPFGWKSHLTSGGRNKWTFRMNSNLNYGW